MDEKSTDHEPKNPDKSLPLEESGTSPLAGAPKVQKEKAEAEDKKAGVEEKKAVTFDEFKAMVTAVNPPSVVAGMPASFLVVGPGASALINQGIKPSQITVLESNHSVAKSLNARGITTHELTLAEFNVSKRFDYIFLSNGSDISDLKDAANLLAPGGSLVSVIPDRALSNKNGELLQDYYRGKKAEVTTLPSTGHRLVVINTK
jgi:hypothetical protein